jgi:hypothetical protein
METIRPAKSYSCHYRQIKSGKELRCCLRAGDYAWPGGYSIAYITSDGAILSPETVRDNLYSVIWSIKNNCDDGWKVVGTILDCETDEEMICSYSGMAI